jgi:hypothetical protein
MQLQSNADGDLFDGSAQMSFTQMNRDEDDVMDDHDKENSPLLPRHSSLDRVQHGDDYDQTMDEPEIPPVEHNGSGSAEPGDESHEGGNQRSESLELSPKAKGKSKGKGKNKPKKEPPPKKKPRGNTNSKALGERKTNLKDLEGKCTTSCSQLTLTRTR